MSSAVIFALIALVISALSAWWSHKGVLTTSEHQHESARRTEHGIMVRWALEHAAAEDPNLRALGVGTLDGLFNQKELTVDEQRVIVGAARALLRERAEAYGSDVEGSRATTE